MNPIRIVLAILAVGFLRRRVRAGVYNLNDPLPQHLPPLPFLHDQIQLVLGPLARLPCLRSRASLVPTNSRRRNSKIKSRPT